MRQAGARRAGGMRVTGGRGRGRRVGGPDGEAIRPTTARVREAVFDILGARIHGADFLDAYAGTGAVGVEALSRGARRVVFIEADSGALRLIRRNLAASPPEAYRIIGGRAVEAMGRLARAGEAFAIAFLDPPYGDPSLRAALARAARIVAAEGMIVVEHRRCDPIDIPEGAPLRPGRSYRHGDTALTTFFVLAS